MNMRRKCCRSKVRRQIFVAFAFVQLKRSVRFELDSSRDTVHVTSKRFRRSDAAARQSFFIFRFVARIATVLCNC